jgi:OmpR family response regulator RpaB
MFGKKKASTKTILIVEDEAPLRRALEEKFSHAGFDVVTAANGEEGLEIGLDRKPALILLDIIMPRLDGLKMLKALRADKGWGADVPVMVLTNSKEKGDIVAALQEGVTQYLAKADWHIEDIVTRARELLHMEEKT